MAKQFSLLTEYSETELKEIILSTVQEVFNSIQNKLPPFTITHQTTEQLFSRTEICKKLQLSRPTIAKLQKTGTLKSIKAGGSYRYTNKHISDFINGM